MTLDPDVEERREAEPRGEKAADRGAEEAHGRSDEEATRAPADDELRDRAADRADQDEQQKTNDGHSNSPCVSSGEAATLDEPERHDDDSEHDEDMNETTEGG